MKYLSVISIFLLFSFTKTTSDRELFDGTWSFHQLWGADGKLAYSADPAEQAKLTEELLREQLAILEGAEVDEAQLREMIAEQLVYMGKVTFEFDSKAGTVKTFAGNNNKTTSTYFLNEKTKEITIKSANGQKLTYTYILENDLLTLKSESEGFTLQRN